MAACVTSPVKLDCQMTLTRVHRSKRPGLCLNDEKWPSCSPDCVVSNSNCITVHEITVSFSEGQTTQRSHCRVLAHFRHLCARGV